MSSGLQIATVTMNAAIDQTALAPRFTAGEVNRVERTQSDAGGKGVNVASFLTHFGYEIAATGLLGLGNAEPFNRLFAEKGIADYFVKVPGLTRVNIKIVDEVQSRVTDINFPGLDAGSRDVESVFSAVETLAIEGIEWFVLSGSLPGGMPVDVYRDMVSRLNARGKHVVLDTSGQPLSEAISAGPEVIKPNIDELKELTGAALQTDTEIVAAAGELVAKGIRLVAVSMGARGAIFVTKDEAVLATPPKVTVKSTVGAGDAMVSGIVHGSIKGLPTGDLACLATAFSLGALGEIGPQLPPLATIEAFIPRIITHALTV